MLQIKYTNGDSYAGSHKNGIKTGDGEYRTAEKGITYRGLWKDNMRHGRGSIIYSNSNESQFEGIFENDEIQTGEFTDPLGNVFKTQEHPESTYEAPMNGNFVKGRLCNYGVV